MRGALHESRSPPPGETSERSTGELVRLLAAALVTGALAGLLGSAFRIVLGRLHVLRGDVLAWAHRRPAWGWLVAVLGAAALVGFARWLTRRWAPDASGSGIPHVEGVVREDAPLGSTWLNPVKFVGGAAALGAGLALGREGPTVQMGAVAGQRIGHLVRAPAADVRRLVAAGAGAGLGAAFTAPLGGAVFVLEEIVQRFELRILVATLTACSASIGVTYQLLGTRPDFVVRPLVVPSFLHFAFYLALGVPLGLVGAAYNVAIVRALDVTDRFTGPRSDLAAAAIGGMVGLVGWFLPQQLGSGETLVGRLLEAQPSLVGLLGILGVRFLLGPLSYAAQTPGGLFAPLLVIGGTVGGLCGLAAHAVSPLLLPDPLALTLVGMAGFFAATVRAPITGMVLALELTGVSTLFVPMLAACGVAAAVPALIGNAPIYDVLRERARRRRPDPGAGAAGVPGRP